MMFQTTCRFSSYLSNKISTTQTQQKRLFRLEASAADVVLYSDPRQKQTQLSISSADALVRAKLTWEFRGKSTETTFAGVLFWWISAWEWCADSLWADHPCTL